MKNIIYLTGLLLLASCAVHRIDTTRDVVNVGTGPNTGTGDPLRTAFIKINTQFGHDSTQWREDIGDSSRAVVNEVKEWARDTTFASDTTHLSDRINLKLNKTDTASLSNRIDLKQSAPQVRVIASDSSNKAAGDSTQSLREEMVISLAAKATNQAIADSLANMKAGIFNVLDYGADPTGVADATSAIQACFDAALADKVYNQTSSRVVGEGAFLISSTITMSVDADLGTATFKTASTSDTAIVWKDRVGYDRGHIVTFPRVVNTTGTIGDGTWTGNSVGIAIVNTRSITFNVPYIENFVDGLLLTTQGAQGTRGTNFNLGEIYDCQTGIHLKPLTSGWTNENRFSGGSILNGHGDLVAGTRAIMIDSAATYQIDGNVFFGINCEGAAWGYAIECYGQYNNFYELRYESSARVKYGYDVSSDKESMHNKIVGGYDSHQIVYTYSPLSSGTRRNYYVGPTEFYNTGNITAGTGITNAMLQRMMYYNGGSAIDITANPQIADGWSGQLITIVGSSDTNTLTLDDGNGLALSAQCVLGIRDAITLVYNVTLDIWVEVSRSAND